MPNKLSGKVALVTGGGSGFGAAISARFAEEGAKVFIGDINLTGASAIANKYPDRVIAGELNVTKRSDWDAAVKRIITEFGRLDILVNNAGTSHKNKPTLEVTEEEYHLTFNVNCFGIFHSIQAVFPNFLTQGGGVCLNISSVGADRPRHGLVWYNASKGAVSNATKGLALEYGPKNIRVNSICPLLSGTGLFEAFTGVADTLENRAKYISNVPLGRLSEVDDVANAALFLCSDEASFITGVNFPVDGGRGI
ncbi:oxidoreductase [Aaosphaeria arxii CBS 175.79]|uniref:Oxidoreductase n=1 Tax=Aaosphaeria arxii CBS 175.79 TaxID=1450172 RepID=A0A6A5X9H6_9PLEO|nr:oxidoreductase [Aaosphaeria arxii CBS 175.79]KAF2009417.1 oxidoreductase [Aaosphaeria arxii CBS 175.79]